MTDVYLRDLNNELRNETIRALKNSNKTKILEAIENNDDVIVGKFLPTNAIKIA